MLTHKDALRRFSGRSGVFLGTGAVKQAASNSMLRVAVLAQAGSMLAGGATSTVRALTSSCISSGLPLTLTEMAQLLHTAPCGSSSNGQVWGR